MAIYLDAVWVLNFFLDMMLLLLTQALARDNTHKWRICLGAFVASLLVPVSVYYPDSLISSPAGKFLYSVVIIVCAFRFVSVHRSIKLLLLFYFTTFAVGGGMVAVHFLLQSPVEVHANSLTTYNTGFGDPVSWLFVLIAFPVAWKFTKIRMDKHAVEKIRYDQVCPVTILVKERTYHTTGYIDSGNQLIDPITKKPVIICDETILRQWFTEEEWLALKKAEENLDIQSLPASWDHHIQLVPYQGVQGSNGFLFTIRPDQLTVYYDGQKISTDKVLIGMQFAKMTKDESYHCLLHPQIIKLETLHSA
ncbi:sigma-E processing peptidase SpoIIGA [Virgibacillus xinjiangensis]|uniref:Sporulation sigma-E factor-processing peptidase n=1 Tax=Virgibacillus xinjiangensis TaxID=393090 RepID=A0ABV7CUU5_9BACI